MVQVLFFAPSVALLKLKLTVLLTFLNGIMMVAALIKQSPINQKSFLSQLLSIEIHSDEVIIFLLCARLSIGKTTNVKNSFQLTLTSDISLKRFGNTQPLKLKKFGTVSNKSTPLSQPQLSSLSNL